MSLLAVPYSRRELPGWGRLLRLVGMFDDQRWRGAPEREVIGKLHGYRMRVQLSNWSERHTYYLGRFYDLETQLTLMRAVRAGDTVVDIGANIGMMTLLAARLVGTAGRVIAFEPNPVASKRIAESLKENGIGHVELHRCALGEQPSVATLSVVTEHSGMGTLAALPVDHERLVSAKYEVEVAKGDDLLRALPAGAPTVVKIDVEGFELAALGGAREFLAARRPLIVSEVIDSLLQRAGASAQELTKYLESLGYEPCEIRTRRRGLGRELLLRPTRMPGAPGGEPNIAWLPRDGVFRERLSPFLGEAGS